MPHLHAGPAEEGLPGCPGGAPALAAAGDQVTQQVTRRRREGTAWQEECAQGGQPPHKACTLVRQGHVQQPLVWPALAPCQSRSSHPSFTGGHAAAGGPPPPPRPAHLAKNSVWSSYSFSLPRCRHQILCRAGLASTFLRAGTKDGRGARHARGGGRPQPPRGAACTAASATQGLPSRRHQPF